MADHNAHMYGTVVLKKSVKIILAEKLLWPKPNQLAHFCQPWTSIGHGTYLHVSV